VFDRWFSASIYVLDNCSHPYREIELLRRRHDQVVWKGIQCIREVNRCHNQVCLLPLRVLEQLIPQYTMFAASIYLLDQAFLCININSVLQVHLLENSCHQAQIEPVDAIRNLNWLPVLQVVTISFRLNEKCSTFRLWIHHSITSNYGLDGVSHDLHCFWISCFHDPVAGSIIATRPELGPRLDNISDIIFW
jgi:hypothetical protein